MAAQTERLRFAFVQGDVLRLVQGVAVGAGEIFLLVGAAGPEQLVAILVAGLATGVARGDIGRPLRPETDIRVRLFAPAVMGRAGAVAGGAGGRASTLQRPVHRSEYGVNPGARLQGMAIHASRLLLGYCASGDEESAQGKQ
jgi:hypothetical protein